MTFNSEFPQTLLNEVLSITAQEYTLVRRTKLIKQLLNEVLSITAQECVLVVPVGLHQVSSMKS